MGLEGGKVLQAIIQPALYNLRIHDHCLCSHCSQRFVPLATPRVNQILFCCLIPVTKNGWQYGVPRMRMLGNNHAKAIDQRLLPRDCYPVLEKLFSSISGKDVS